MASNATMANTTARGNHKNNPLYIDVSSDSPYTCEDRVAGTVRVDPTLRPQHISVSFKGYCIFHDQTPNGVRPTFFEFSKDLFVSDGAHENFDILRKGTAKDGKVELPFEFIFPTTSALAPPSDRNWHYSKDSYDHPRFQHSPGFLLPPILPFDLVSNLTSAPKVIYSVEASMDSNVPHMKVQQELKFVPPTPEYDLSLLEPRLEFGTRLPKHMCRYKFIRTRKLLPGYHGFSKFERIRDLLVEKELFFGLDTLSEVPFVKFNIVATPARVLVLDSPLPIHFTVHHLERSSSLPHQPDLFIRRIRVQIMSALHIFVPKPANSKGAGKENSDIIHDSLTVFDRKFEEGSGTPLYDGLKLSDLGDVKLSHPKLVPTFTSYGLASECEIQVNIWGECATHEFSGIVCRDQVQIAPKWTGRPPPDPVPESPISPLQADRSEPDLTTAGSTLSPNARIPMPPRYPSGPTPTTFLPPSGPAIHEAVHRPLPPPYVG